MSELWSTLPVVGSAICAAALHITRKCHGRWTADSSAGVQKLHEGQPPRVGVIPILVGAVAGVVALSMNTSGGRAGLVAAEAASLLLAVLLCALPATAMGLLEDLTKRVRARWRLLAPAVGVLLAAVLLQAVIPRVGIPWVDQWVQWAPVGLAVTMLMVVGFTHAMNLVDGLNGLASGLSVLMLAATGWVCHQLGDAALAQVCWVLALSVLGFMVLNFPRGLVFLGDGGAYFLGFALALVWVLLLVRNPEGASPWFVMAVAFHATMETIFSIVRRKLRRRPKNATAPDRLHFHSLVLRRRVRARVNAFVQKRLGSRSSKPWMANALSSVLVLASASVPVMLAVLWPGKDLWGLVACTVGVGLYLMAYSHMVRFGWSRPRGGVAPASAHASLRLRGQSSANDSMLPLPEPARVGSGPRG